MDTRKNLYFLPLIDEALGSDEPEEALKDAFAAIRKLGKKPEYERGYAQFRKFMKAHVEAYAQVPGYELIMREAIYHLIDDLATDTYEGSEEEKQALIEALSRNSKWRTEYEHAKETLAEFRTPSPELAIEVLKDGKTIASFPVSEIPFSLTDIEPGRYTVRLSNGRVLWEGLLDKKHLLWWEAYGDSDLPMAAKTEKDAPRPTVSESLMDGDVTMDVIPDLQSGEIRFSHGEQRR